MKRFITSFSKLFSPFVGLQSSDVSLDCRLTVGSPSGLIAKCTLILCLLMTIGVGSVWGADQTITLTQSVLGITVTSYTNSDGSKTVGDVDFSWDKIMKNGSDLQLQASNGVLWNTSLIPGKIVSVAVTKTDASTARSTTCNMGTSAKATTYNESKSGTATFNSSAHTNTCLGYFYLKRGNNAAYWTQVVITYTPATINLSESSISGLDYNLGSGPSSAGSFTVSGSEIPANLVVTAPSNFEVSTDNGSTWGSEKTISVTLTGSSNAGKLTAANGTVKVRLKSGLSANTYNGNVSIAMAGCNTITNVNPKSVAVSGTVTAAACTATPSVGAASLNGSFSLTSVGVQCASASAGSNCSLSEWGFVWSTSNASGHPNKDDNVVTNTGSYAANYTNSLTGSFSADQTYYYRGYAKNNGNNYGYSADIRSFTPRTVNYNKNESSASGTAPSQQVVNSGGTVTLAAASAFTWTGHSIVKWAHGSADGTQYTPGGTSPTISASTTFYAIWETNKHAFAWSWGGGSTTSTTHTADNANMPYGTAINYPANNTMSRTGYTFNGWSSNATTMPDEDLTITAQWTANQYDITYYDGDATLTNKTFSGTQTDAPAKHTYGTATTLKIPTKTGYTFGGWYTSSTCTTGAVGTSSAASLGATDYTANITLYAKWTPITYSVAFNANGGSGSTMSNQGFTYDVAQNLSANTYTAPDHKYFIGWDTNPSATTATYTDEQNVSNLSTTNSATVTLYAIWTDHTYTNYRTLCTAVTCGELSDATNTSITKTGATIGWSDVTGTGTLDHYEYAVWVNGETEPESGFTSTGSTASATLSGLNSSTQYRWKARRVCTGGDGESTWLRSTFTTLAATVTYHVATGADAVDASTTASGLSAGTIPAACGNCWEFAGWTNSANSSHSGSSAPAVLYEAGEIISVSGDIDLYAVYMRNEFIMVNQTSDLVNNGYYALGIYGESEEALVLSNTAQTTYPTTDAAVTDVSSKYHEADEDHTFIHGLHPNNIWKFTGTTSSGQLYNEASGKYINLTDNEASLLGTTDNLTFTRSAADDWSWIIKSTYYLQGYADDGAGYQMVTTGTWDGLAAGQKYSTFIYKCTESTTFTTSPTCETYTVTWNNNGSTSTVQVSACSGSISAVPSAPSPISCSEVFVGWSTTDIGSTGLDKDDDAAAIAALGLFKDVDHAPYIDRDMTFYAVFASASDETSDPFYEKVTATGDITNDGRYLIVYETDNIAFNSAASPLDAYNNNISVATITDGKITPTDATDRTRHAAAEFTIDMTNLYIKTASDKYINADSYNNELDANISATAVHSISIDANGDFVVEGTGQNTSSPYDYAVLRFNSTNNTSSYRFRFYKGTQQKVQLYKYNEGTVYTDYVTSCCAQKVAAPSVTGTSTKNSVTLNWADVTGADAWKVTINGNTYDVTKVAHTYTATGLTPNTAYAWTVVATYSGSYCGATAASGSTTTAQVYSVTYDKNTSIGSGTVTMTVPVDGSTYAAGETVTAATPSGTPSNSGYTYNGWNTEPDGSGEHVDAGGTIDMVAGGLTLYAEWTPKRTYYVDRLHGLGDQTIIIDGKEYHCFYGDGYHQAPNPSDQKSGDVCQTAHYRFLYWQTKSHINNDGTQKDTGSPLNGGANHAANGDTYYAIWVEEVE